MLMSAVQIGPVGSSEYGLGFPRRNSHDELGNLVGAKEGRTQGSPAHEMKLHGPRCSLCNTLIFTDEVIVRDYEDRPFHESCFAGRHAPLPPSPYEAPYHPRRPSPTVQGGLPGLNRKKR